MIDLSLFWNSEFFCFYSLAVWRSIIFWRQSVRRRKKITKEPHNKIFFVLYQLLVALVLQFTPWSSLYVCCLLGWLAGGRLDKMTICDYHLHDWSKLPLNQPKFQLRYFLYFPPVFPLTSFSYSCLCFFFRDVCSFSFPISNRSLALRKKGKELKMRVYISLQRTGARVFKFNSWQMNGFRVNINELQEMNCFFSAITS